MTYFSYYGRQARIFFIHIWCLLFLNSSYTVFATHVTILLQHFATTIKNLYSGNILFPSVHAETTTVKNIAERCQWHILFFFLSSPPSAPAGYKAALL